MKTVTIDEARASLAELVELASHGQSFAITMAGTPVVKIVALDAKRKTSGRTGFMAGQIAVPDDFDRLGDDEIAELFGTGS